MKSMIFRMSFVAVLLFPFLGCQDRRPPGMPKLYPVTLTITQNGAPLEGARVDTVPADQALSQWGGAGAAPTDASGQTLMYSYGAKGLIAGEHKVIVNKEILHRPPGEETDSKDTYEFFVDSKFWAVHTTPLTCSVQPGTKEFIVEVEPFNPKTYNARRYGKRLKR